MKKKLIWVFVILLWVIVGGGWYLYNKYDSKLIRLTPEVVKKLQETVAAQNEAAIKKPEFRPRTLQSKNLLKNVYATSGTRIRLRFFAGWDLKRNMVDRTDMVAAAYEDGVPMGGVLSENRNIKIPKFLIWAAKDPVNANLDRVQMIKGWIEEGERKEQVFDIACSDGLIPNSDTGKCPDNGAEVNLDTCEITEDSGDEEIKVLWTDDNFNPEHTSFYYVRVLQNLTCRWSTYDAIRLGIEPIKEVPATIKERAWSSPIWYSQK